jgi:hypothetical protein
MAQQRLMLESMTFGILTVREFVGCNETRHSEFRCECLCGEIITARGSDLIAGSKRKCGPDCTYRPPKFRVMFSEIDRRGSTAHFAK